MPEALPTVGRLPTWMSEAAVALVAASAYNDRADIPRLTKVNDQRVSFESLADSEEVRFQSLDARLADSLQLAMDRDELSRELN